ncbi:MAG: hypothetical protein D3925_14820 [Candidatus Electrothrix sp. AR5]|nr:hypothetical protein [Candidatus Electrothrix sp. AR5]
MIKCVPHAVFDGKGEDSIDNAYTCIAFFATKSDWCKGEEQVSPVFCAAQQQPLAYSNAGAERMMHFKFQSTVQKQGDERLCSLTNI